MRFKWGARIYGPGGMMLGEIPCRFTSETGALAEARRTHPKSHGVAVIRRQIVRGGLGKVEVHRRLTF